MSDQATPHEMHPNYIEQLFEWVYCDLGARWEATRKASDQKAYHRLNMARLVRPLLSDGTPLAQLAAQQHKFKLLFLSVDRGPFPPMSRQIPPEYKEAYEAVKLTLPNLPGEHHVHVYDRSGYLNKQIAVLGDRKLAVGDVIKFLANSYGGVHLVPYLKEEDQRHFAEWNKRLKIHGEGVMFERVDQIVPVVLRSLHPLRTVILAQHGVSISMPSV